MTREFVIHILLSKCRELSVEVDHNVDGNFKERLRLCFESLVNCPIAVSLGLGTRRRNSGP